MTTDATTVRLTGLRKSYGTTTVLDVPRLDLHGGQIVALVGENGAGKSTLTGILSGIVRPDEGTVEIGGVALRTGDPGHAQQLGAAHVSQEFPLVGQLSVAENLLLGHPPTGTRRVLVDRAAQRRQARALLDRIGATIGTDRLVETLTVPQQQLIEVAKALGRNPRVLVLDEPTSALGPVESAAVLAAARELADAGAVVVFIGHRLDEVREVAQRVLVLRNGRLVADLTPGEATEQRLVRAMVGAELSDLVGEPRTAAQDRNAFTASALTAPGIGPIDLTLRAGEILGVAGLMGSGRSRLLHTVMGAIPRTGGVMTLDDRPYDPGSPADAAAAGVGLVPEDRKHQALLLDDPVRRNVSLAVLPALSVSRFFLSPRRERAFAAEAAQAATVKCTSIEQPVRGLSGGNQQKSVFGRWFAARPRLLLLDEPTRGVDVGAKAGIYRLIEQAAADGMAVLVASSELEELMQLTHRIAVMSHGRLVRTFDRDQFSKEAVMTAATIGAAR
ncbi:sugar ABC transporter ATP-binding protein [Actinoplanes sp. M2I2]|uniref:sugar ABC transporter ATP-binding protein n=1 Tax=Actinoplanes sp. M2I2 TaxID=1734444 RepID=UPI002020F831|nr:sugar ABC transporter ATP-binding protein [Actinoplanes sp. M2I2]